MTKGYFETLSTMQYNNIRILINRMNEKGVTNKYAQAAILAVISKESAFMPSYELGYKTTANDRIRAIFSVCRPLDDKKLNELKADSKKFFNLVYGGRYGNVAGTDDGYKYRGGGFNQITFKANYAQAGIDSGVDLMSKPEMINDVKTAADAVIGYFVRRFKSGKRDINALTTLELAANDVYAANAGKLGQTISVSEPTGGYAKVIARAAGFYEFIKQYSGESGTKTFLNLKGNIMQHVLQHETMYLIIFLLIIAAIIYYNYN